MVQANLPTFPGGELPSPDARLTRRTTRAATLLALAVTIGYLAWRTVETVNWSVWWVAVPLLGLELHAAVSLALFAFAAWDTTAVAPAPPVSAAPGKVAVLVQTYNEPVEVLLPTVAAAVALRPAHETWVLDDGDRPEVAALARELGAHYLTRPTHEHAKAGNVNHALQVIDADFVAILDADHVAMPGLLVHTLGYFADPRMAVVQTPQDFYNTESFEHERRRTWFQRSQDHQVFNEQQLFYRVIQPGKNRCGGAFWCGTGAVVRVAALRDVGGVAVETVTEDIHTTIRLHRRGWHTVYHNEVLARGLAAADVDQYAAQRVRWGTGAMQVLRGENPIFVRGLTLGQRLSYAGTLLGWFDSWRSLGYLLIPPVVLVTGAVPIRAHSTTFLLAFGMTFLIQRFALQRLGQGRAPAVLSTVFEFVRMEANLLATLTLITRRKATFRVTAKGRVGGERRRGRVPVLLEGVLLVSLAAALWFVATAAGITPLHYGVVWATYGAAFWLLVNCGFVAAAAVRVRDDRFAAERRAAVRFDVDLAGRLGQVPVMVKDLSLTGARVVASAGLHTASLCAGHLRMHIGAEPLDLAVVVRSRRAAGEDLETIGLEFAGDQNEERSRLALALFHSNAVPILVPAVEPPADLPMLEESTPAA